jgi:proteasome lid subunit RPN8/RPN11
VSLSLAPEHVADIRARGRGSYPHECCGALLGATDERFPGDKRVLAVVDAANEREDSPANRFLIPADRVRRIEADARSRGLDLVGFYHSHPDHPARPSEFDREHAWPWYSYVILEVREGRDGALRAWRLAEDRSGFEEEPLEERR